MIKHPSVSRVTDLDEEWIEKIVSVIPDVYIMKHVAQINKIPYQTLHHWMTKGRKEIKAGVEDSIYIKLVKAYDYKLSTALKDMLANLKECPKNYGALTWILEHCYKEEFMTLPDDVQRIIDIFNQHIKPMMEKGVSFDGSEKTKEVHTESD